MKKYSKFLIIFLLSSLFLSCSQAVISFGEIGMRLPWDENNEPLYYEVVVSNNDYSRKLSGKSGDTLIIDELDYGKYKVHYEAISEKNPKIKYTGNTFASVYVGIFSPVKISLEE